MSIAARRALASTRPSTGTPGPTAPTVGGSTSGSSDAAAVVLTTPACSAGDLLVAFWAIEALTRTPALPTGWAWLYQQDATGVRTAVLTRTADAADAAGASHTFAMMGGSYGVDHAIVFVSVVGTAGLDVHDLDVVSLSADYTVTPGVTPNQAANLALHASMWRGTITGYTPPAGPGSWSTVTTEETLPGGRVAVAASTYATADPTGPVTANLGTARNGTAALLVIAPA